MSEHDELESMSELVEELTLGTARGGRRPGAKVSVVEVRGLGEVDLELLENPPNSGVGPQFPEIKHQHHQIAGLIAKGVDNAEISLITGFAPSYISMLKSSPDMKELVEYYRVQAEERTVNAIARLKQMGVSSIEEVQKRLNEAPEKFTHGQLMDMVEIGLIKPMAVGAAAAGAQGGAGAASGIQINLNFKSPELSSAPGTLIEGKAK